MNAISSRTRRVRWEGGLLVLAAFAEASLAGPIGINPVSGIIGPGR